MKLNLNLNLNLSVVGILKATWPDGPVLIELRYMWLVRNLVVDACPVGVQAGLELVQGWSEDDVRGESVPIVDDSDTEAVSSNPRPRQFLVQLHLVSSCPRVLCW